MSKINIEPASASSSAANAKRLEGTRTDRNLRNAFSGESEARNKYTFFASVARKEGYEQVARIFEETASNEKEHAEIWFKDLNGIGNTLANLHAAIAGEHYENSDMYPQFAAEAREEGFPDIALKFEQIGAIEKTHEQRFAKYAREMEQNSLYTCPKEVTWICLNCGHQITSANAPEICPVCQHPQGYFEFLHKN